MNLRPPAPKLHDLGGSWTSVTFSIGDIATRRTDTHMPYHYKRGFSAEREPSGAISVNGTLPKEAIDLFINWLNENYEYL